MQKASRASESSNSNITVRTRKKSGTSSLGGDSLAADRESGSADGVSKTKARSAKCNMRLLASNLKNLRKPAKSGRAQRLNFRSLQNTIVLAPFHSLKKCFQTKLVDLYSFEKIKNINRKTQIPKKKNMSFEYDIIELNSSEPMVKREGKVIKKMRQKSKCANYCQCKKTGSISEEKTNLKNTQRGRKMNRRQVPRLSEHLKTKKRKLSGEIISPIILKTELTPVRGCYQPNDQVIFSHANSSPSAKSSHSKCDSWEFYSNSPTLKEEHMEGSLVISTTSFDSQLEHFDKRRWDHSDSSRRFKKQGKCKKSVEKVDASCANSPRHLTMHVETKNSDEQTVNFIGRESQTRPISSQEPNQQLQPLQLQSKAKCKKPENEPVADYNLRSLSSSTEKIVQKRNQKLHEPRSTGNTFKQILQIEVATQVEGNTLERRSSTFFLKKNHESATNVYCTSQSISSDKIPEEPPLSSSQKVKSPPTTISDMRFPCEVSHLPRIDPLESQVEGIKSHRSEGELNVSEKHSGRASMELITGLSEQLQGPTNSQKSQGKETDFIFGSRNTAAKLGESCEFSFGLNWVFSDDDED